MTITVEYANQSNRWHDGILFDMDAQDERSVIVDYTGEIGSDTVSTAVSTTVNITAGASGISSNVVTIPLSAATENTTATLDVLMTTTAGDKISRKVSFRVGDL